VVDGEKISQATGWVNSDNLSFIRQCDSDAWVTQGTLSCSAVCPVT